MDKHATMLGPFISYGKMKNYEYYTYHANIKLALQDLPWTNT